ncbi:MAG TPA: succinylglutamate desuccinylase/aspartoacylase family protein [Chiayiivirga sp.]|nr:succinylglutamate desuccinylase/aspartoacylase family protein [Chiayiivirga sp.]
MAAAGGVRWRGRGCFGLGLALMALAAAAQAPLPPQATPADAFVGPPPLIPAGDPASSEFVGPVLVGPFTILDTQVLPGKRARLEWNAGMSFSGSEVISPVVVAHGVRPGPVLCLTAGIHGDELNSVEIVRRIVNGVEPADLGGTLIAVPVVNLFGFSRNSRYLPDRRDLNRYFPGTRHGSIASRIAYNFFIEIVQRCDALVDLHTGSFDRRNLPQVRADLSRPEVREFTRGFGATTVLHSAGSRGMLRNAAIQAGIPAVTFEVGGPGELEAEEIVHGEQAISTLMHKLGMTRHLPAWDEPQPIFYDSSWVRSDAGGLLLGRVRLGESVEPGQVLGIVIDPINNIERDLVSPVRGRVIGMARNQVVLPGFAVFHLGEETSEQQVVSDAQRGSRGVTDEDGGRDPADPESLPLDDELDQD